MKTSEIHFPRLHQQHRHLDARRYSIDALIDIIGRNPREVDALELEDWKIRRRINEAGQATSALVEPTNIEHTFSAGHLPLTPLLPILVCKRHGRTVIIDGVHRAARSVMSDQRNCPCVYVTYRELKRCRVASRR